MSDQRSSASGTVRGSARAICGTSPGERVGSAVALASAMAFALNVSFVPLAYEAGANVHAVNLVRPSSFGLCLLVLLIVGGTALRLPARTAAACLALGALLGIEMYLLLGAIAYIPVGLTVLIMYTYPLIVAVFSHLDGRDRLSARKLAIMLFVFLGLALALRAPMGSMDWRGVALAMLTSLTFAMLVYFSERALRGQDRRVVMLYMMAGATVLIAVVIALFATPAWPRTHVGWLGLGGATAFFIAATFLLFTAIGMIGPLRTAIIDNTSPVWAIVFAFVLVGERMNPIQLLGVTIVLCGVVLFQIASRRFPPMPG